MIIKKFNAKEYTSKLKATIQASGKLGFTQETIKTLELTPDCSVLIGQEEGQGGNLYMGVLREQREDAFPVIASGQYVNLNTKQLFDELKVEYTKWTIMYDLLRFKDGDDAMGAECYKMVMRKNPRNQDEKEE